MHPAPGTPERSPRCQPANGYRCGLPQCFSCPRCVLPEHRRRRLRAQCTCRVMHRRGKRQSNTLPDQVFPGAHLRRRQWPESFCPRAENRRLLNRTHPSTLIPKDRRRLSLSVPVIWVDMPEKESRPSAVPRNDDDNWLACDRDVALLESALWWPTAESGNSPKREEKFHRQLTHCNACRNQFFSTHCKSTRAERFCLARQVLRWESRKRDSGNSNRSKMHSQKRDSSHEQNV